MTIELADNQSVPFEEKLKIKENFSFCRIDLSTQESHLKVLSLNATQKEPDHRNDSDLILSAKKDDQGRWTVSTGNYVGEITIGKQNFQIASRFGIAFLKRMLNFADDVFLTDVDVLPQEKTNSKPPPIGALILRYLFVQSLERAHVLGLPKSYAALRESSPARMRGRLDVAQYVRVAIPFTGRLPTVSRVQRDVKAIAAVLLKAVQIVQKDVRPKTEKKPKDKKNESKNVHHPLLHIQAATNHLREVNAGVRWQSIYIREAKNHKALMNPIFTPYKTALRYAELIIQSETLGKAQNGKELPYFGFMVNVAELFEIYIRKLLHKSFPSWHIHSPHIELHSMTFFERKIIPDIVMERGNDVVVFDTKYKRMNFTGRMPRFGAGDLDREDFFQINTYMAYYAQHQGKRLLGGGLLYPIETAYPREVSRVRDSWFGHEIQPFFVVDGIDLSVLHIHNEGAQPMIKDQLTSIETAENSFINRMSDLLERSSAVSV